MEAPGDDANPDGQEGAMSRVLHELWLVLLPETDASNLLAAIDDLLLVVEVEVRNERGSWPVILLSPN